MDAIFAGSTGAELIARRLDAPAPWLRPPTPSEDALMKTLVILNDAPYGCERTYNGLRLAGSLARKGGELRMFLIGDAVAASTVHRIVLDVCLTKA